MNTNSRGLASLVKRAPTLWLTASLLALSILSSSAALFGPRGDSPEEKRQVVLKQRKEMLAELYKTKPELKGRLKEGAGDVTGMASDLVRALAERG